VEASLRQHPDVAEVAVVGVPSEVSEDDLKAVVVLRSGAALTEEQLFHWSVEHVPFFALPRYIELVEECRRAR
jgi:crotonobetaine/carnitine-CoA ligase